MKVEITPDKKYIKILEATNLEMKQLQMSFTKKVKDFHFKKKKFANSNWTGDIPFIENIRYIPAGLWLELIDVCERFELPINTSAFKGLVDSSLKLENVAKELEDMYGDGPKKLRDYQKEAVYLLLKYRLASSELATGSGKTLMAFNLMLYLKNKWETLGYEKPFKMIYITPTIDLILQGIDDFAEYNSHNCINYKIKAFYGETKDKSSLDGVDIAIGTWQTYKDMSPEILSEFTVVLVDEAHIIGAVSVKKIIENCKNRIYTFGVSGTLDSDTKDNKKTADDYTIAKYIGPIVNKIPSEFLIKEGFLTPLQICVFRMNYLEQEHRLKLKELLESETFENKKVMELEQKIVRGSKPRFKFITKVISQTPKNSLVLFRDVQGGYGKKVYEHLRENSHGKHYYYVDGSVKTDHRKYIKDILEEGDNRCVIASYGTFSTGISINNLHNLFLIESYKSKIIIKQSLGRLMRLLKGKSKANIFDFVDDFRVSSRGKRNILYQHGMDRIDIYDKENHKYKIFNVKL